MWQRFTERTRRVIFFAQEEAARLGRNYVGTEHVLLGLLRENDTEAMQVLERLGVSPTRLRKDFESQLMRGDGRLGQEMQLTPRCKRVIDLAYEEARTLACNFIGPEHLLLGLIRESESLAGKVLAQFGVDLERARHEAAEIQQKENAMKPDRKRESVPSPPVPSSPGRAPFSPPPPAPHRRFGHHPLSHMTLDEAIRHTVQAALAEDLTPNDITTDLTVPAETRSRAIAIAKADGVIAGMEAARLAFNMVDPTVDFVARVQDGERVQSGAEIFDVIGPARSLLMAERTALNLLQRLSGVATETARYVEAVQGTQTKIVDTRKTTPGLRRLEKYAVRRGGGHNHRYNLSDGILIKDNHIVAAGGIRAAVERVKAEAPHTLRIEVEVTNEDEIREALDAGADVLLLDNMTPDRLRAAVDQIGGRALTEASGGITLESVRAMAEAGVDLISVGALTHSVHALDISLQFRTLESP
ncbi:MAG: carboxylating nicotinate-nucleotide diphosphorylase [Armatimonadetes bacterium]|nr:carboxylating nicotinate-nucleotide diphosphorylase [Armatimonadota bacterium]